MTPDLISENRRQYADYSLEDLKKLPVKKLRQIAPSVGVSNIFQDGKLTKAGQGRQATLSEAIYQACEDARIAKNVRSRETDDDGEGINPTLYEEDVNKLAEKYYKGLHSYTINCLRENVAFSPEFFTLVAPFREDLIVIVDDRSPSGKASNNTINNWKSQVLKRIESLVNQHSSEFPDDRLKAEFKGFYRSVQAAFQVERKEKTAQTNIAIKTRQNNTIGIKVLPLFDWAKNQVVNLPESSARWREVAIAIMVLTGRRQSEVMSSGKFELTDSDSHLLFSGQLKRHARDEDVKPYEIPVIGHTAYAIVEAMKWLEANNKRIIPDDYTLESIQKAAKKAHDNFSKYLSQMAEKVCTSYIVLDEGDNWEYQDEKGKTKDRRKSHLFRQIYGQVVYPVFYADSNRKLAQILIEVMGHSDTPSSRSFAFSNYDSDIEVRDIEAIKQAQ